jgi:perosamine synthetase
MIPWYKPHFWGKEKQHVMQALESSWISGGKYLDQLESDMARILNAKHVITTSNGTTSLMLSFLALGLGPGDEIIVPGFTFAAPANMALAIGATPVFADIDPETWLLCPISVAQCITPRTKAIVPVHIYGNMCDMNALTNLSQQHNLAIVEDVAEAAFSTYRGQQAGTFGAFGSFSFQATKTITTGEGGAVCTDDDVLADAARLIRNHGMRPNKRYFHEVIGHNFRLTNLQAALGVAQLEHVDQIIENKKRVFARYQHNLQHQAGIRMQHITPGCDPVMWAVAIKIDPQIFGQDRDTLIDTLHGKGIETRPGFYAFPDMPIYRAPPLAHSSDVGRHTISLPSYTMISNSDIDRICEIFLKQRRNLPAAL